jgi:hypothetical protein
MRNKKINKDLLNEELKRFKMLTGYDYYLDDKTISENFPIVGFEHERPEDPRDEDILLGSISEEEDETDDFEQDIADITSDLGGEEGGDEDSEESLDIPDDTEDIIDDEPMDDDAGIEEPLDDTSDEIELDVTELVKGSEAAKQSADAANAKIGELMNMVNKLEQQLSSMDQITSKIDGLEKEIERRNPTPVEKLEMRSLDSYPYNIKLTDFWNEKSDTHDTGSDLGQKPEEYTLTQDDVNQAYSDKEIRNSFDVEDI